MKNNQTNQPDDNYIDSEKDLILVNKELESHEDFYKMALQFQQIMMVYESAIKQVETKLEILNKEYKVFGRRNPIETIKSRIKTPESIATKLQKKGVPVTFKSMSENLTDIAGVLFNDTATTDIYTIKDVLLKQPDLKLLEEKDYIANPKPSGYRSLHIVIQVPVYLSQTVHHVNVEIQLRTIAMDFWASLEHELRYKTTSKIPISIRRELQRCAETIAMTDREMEEIAIELQALD